MKKQKHEHHVDGIGSIDYWAYRSQLQKMSPGLKMAVACFALILCVGSRNIAACLFVSVTAAVVSVGVGKVPLRVYFNLMKIPLAFMVLSSVAILLDFSHTPVGDYRVALGSVYICCSVSSIWQALRLMVVAFGAVSAMYMLTLSTTVSEMTSVLERLHIPPLLIEFMNMIYRFIFIMSDSYRQLQTAAQSRMGYSGTKKSLRTFGSVVGNLFIVSLLNANTYYDALQARCYNGHLSFLQEKRPVTVLQTSLSGLYCIAVLGIWIITK